MIFFILSALVTTDTELNAIAADAIIGFKVIPQTGIKMPAATGISNVLYTNAKNKFCLIFFIVAFPSFIAFATDVTSE